MMSAEEPPLFNEPKTTGLQLIGRVIGMQAETDSRPIPTRINRLAALNP